MQAVPAPPRGTILKPLAASLLYDKVRLALAGLAVGLGALALALAIHPLYDAQASLLVLLGSEYTYRPAAGENMSVTAALDREQILRTEIAILGSADLHRDVIRAVTVERLYPELLEASGVLSRAKSALRDLAARLLAPAGLRVAPKPPPVDPVEEALVLFDSRLSAEAVRAGNVVNLSFAHRDPEIAAEVLNRLDDAYLVRRRDLYLSHEAGIVSREAEDIRARLEAAEDALEQYKTDNDITDFQVRRSILLNEQGALETDLKTASSDAAQQTARLAQIATQDKDVSATHQTTQNPLFLQLQLDREKASVELQAARAWTSQNVAQLIKVGAMLTALNGNEQRLAQLERARAILEEDFRSAMKVRGERLVTETVQADRQANVRVLQRAVVPALPRPTRKLILLAGAVLSLAAVAGVGLISHFLRRVYLLPETVEADTGLRVLACMPAKPRRAADALAVRPG